MKHFNKISIATLALCMLSFPSMADEYDGIVTKKTAEYDYTTQKGVITLETYAEGMTKIVHENSPADVIVLLDHSSSMGNATLHAGNSNIGEDIENMNAAAKELINMLSGNQPTTGMHQLCLIEFNGSLDNRTSGFMQVTSTNAGDVKVLLTGNRDSGTYTGTALEAAQDIMKDGCQSGSMKYVVVITDGRASSGEDTKAVNAAKKLKDAGVQVYTIAFIGWDAVAGAITDAKRKDICNFMNKVSSNYPSAIGSGYTSSPDYDSHGYFFEAAKSGDAIQDILSRISSDIINGAQKVDLGETIIKDVINTEHFSLPSGTVASDIKVYTADAKYDETQTHNIGFKDKVSTSAYTPVVDLVNNTVSVPGFQPSDEYCLAWVNSYDNSKMVHGKKLIIEIPFVVNESNAEYGEFETNEDGSGVFQKTDPTKEYKEFNKPKADIYMLTVERSGLTASKNAVYEVYRYTDSSHTSKTLLYRIPMSGVAGGATQSQSIYYIPAGDYQVVETKWGQSASVTSAYVEKTVDKDHKAPVFSFSGSKSTSLTENSKKNVFSTTTP